MLRTDRLAEAFNRLSAFRQSGLITAAALAAADFLTVVFYSIFFSDRLWLDLALTSLIVVVVAFPLSWCFMMRSAKFAELAAELTKANRIDDLTGLLNRKTFLLEAKLLIGVTAGQDGVGTLLFIDADHFKSVNDTFGHATGDAVLCELGAALKAPLLAGDLAGRLGGEEFAVLLIDEGRGRTTHVCESIRQNVKAICDIVGLGKHEITVSIGVSAHLPGQDIETLLMCADKNLYMAKAMGRDTLFNDEVNRAAA
jgi:diguanylate cyclase (GGDEF)-like protein